MFSALCDSSSSEEGSVVESSVCGLHIEDESVADAESKVVV